jgi:hypothetical protein
MPRPKKPKTFVPPTGLRDTKVKFLNFAREHNSSALRSLIIDVSQGTMSLRQWAKNFGQDNTWLEQWAEDTLGLWAKGILPLPRAEKGDLIMDFLLPFHAPIKRFSSTIEGTPISRLSHGVSIFAAPWWDKDTGDDREMFKEAMHARLDHELDQFFEKMIQAGDSDIKLPRDLDAKLEAAALYFLCGEKRAEIADTFHVSEATVYDWLREVQELLALRMKTPGPRRKGQAMLG